MYFSRFGEWGFGESGRHPHMTSLTAAFWTRCRGTRLVLMLAGWRGQSCSSQAVMSQISTLSYSLSSWFTLSWAYHLITVTTFALIIYHSIGLSLNQSVPQTLSSLAFLVLFGLPSWTLDLDRTWWTLALICFNFLFWFRLVCNLC